MPLAQSLFIKTISFALHSDMMWSKYRSDFKKNIQLALPIIIGQVGQIMVNIADNVMVGRLGAAELAAVSLANAVFISFMVVGMGLSFALPPLIAEADGKGAHQTISSDILHSLIINILFAIFSIIAIEIIIPLMPYWGQEENVVQLAIPYLRISAFSLLLFMVFQCLRTYAEGKSKTIPPMIAMIIGNVVNIFLNYVLIYGYWSFPKLGVAGAAWGTFFARFVMLILLFVLIRQWKSLWPDLSRIGQVKVRSKQFKTILRLGIPTSLQGFFEVSSFAFAAVMAGMISKEAQAAHQIAINLASISFLICTGLAMAATIRVGNQLGLQNIRRLRNAGFSAIIQVILFMSLAMVSFLFLRWQLPALYINNQEVIRIAANLLIVASFFQISDGVQVTAIGALRGMQDVNIPTLITFISYWLCALPLGYYLAFKTDLSVTGIWIGLSVGLSLSALFMTYRFNRLSKQLLSD